jgi:uncharacterized membrane protein YhhN
VGNIIAMKSFSLVVFFLSVVGVIVSEVIDHEILFLITKPLILISLITHYYFSVPSQYRSGLLLMALSFSLIGDVLLLRPNLFIGGLVSFLLAHVAYILVYRQQRLDEHENSLQGLHRLRLSFPILLAGTGLVVILYPKLTDLKIPVMFYALVITVMTLTALFRYGRTTTKSFWLVFIGAVLFMISDSILAINKFLSPIDNAGVYIMLTYSIAQFLIVKGLIKHPVEG